MRSSPAISGSSIAFGTPELLPLGSRIRRRLNLEYAEPDELLACLEHLLDTAAQMITELEATLADHAAGNYRALMNLCDELLTIAAGQDRKLLEQKLYLEVFGQPTPTRKTKRRRR